MSQDHPTRSTHKYLTHEIDTANSWKCSPYAAGGEFGQYKMVQKNWKMTETLAYGYSSESTQQELSNEYQHDKV